MPVILEPGIVQKIVLDCDAAKQPQPAFLIRARSLREQRELGMLLDKCQAAENSAELYDGVVNVLSRVIVGWEQMFRNGLPIPFSADALWDTLTMPEAWELIRKALAAGKVDADEKKESELPH